MIPHGRQKQTRQRQTPKPANYPAGFFAQKRGEAAEVTAEATLAPASAAERSSFARVTSLGFSAWVLM